MRPLTRQLAVTLALSVVTALPAVVERANACDDGTTPKRGTRVAASSCPTVSTANLSAATTCDRKPEPVRIAGRTARQAIAPAAGLPSDPQQDPISSDQAWSMRTPTPVHSVSITVPLAPLWFATITDPNVLQRSFQKMGEWARRKSPVTKMADPPAPSLNRAPWVGELI